MNAFGKVKSQQALEPNHTHFLLLDDGTYYDYEIRDYRTRFVSEVSMYHDSNGIDAYRVFAKVRSKKEFEYDL